MGNSQKGNSTNDGAGSGSIKDKLAAFDRRAALSRARLVRDRRPPPRVPDAPPAPIAAVDENDQAEGAVTEDGEGNAPDS